MAVTKIRKMSSWTLLIVSLISIVVLGMFFGGGITNPGEEMKEYEYGYDNKVHGKIYFKCDCCGHKESKII